MENIEELSSEEMLRRLKYDRCLDYSLGQYMVAELLVRLWGRNKDWYEKEQEKYEQLKKAVD